MRSVAFYRRDRVNITVLAGNRHARWVRVPTYREHVWHVTGHGKVTFTGEDSVSEASRADIWYKRLVLCYPVVMSEYYEVQIIGCYVQIFGESYTMHG
jgi:hypothetical protein